MIIDAEEVVFHFNKANLSDPTVPMWTLKIDGKTHYVHHVDADAKWRTKETPDNPHTKGSIKFKHVIVDIDETSKEAKISQKKTS